MCTENCVVYFFYSDAICITEEVKGFGIWCKSMEIYECITKAIPVQWAP